MARFNNNHDKVFSDVCFKRDSCKIILKQGDLLEEKDVDVIVIPTPDYGNDSSHAYPLFDAFCSKADRDLKQQIRKSSGDIRSGDPPRIISDIKPSIILTPIPYYGKGQTASKMLRNTYSNCLKLAFEHKYEKIAFPTIGCGKSGFPPREAADCLHQALTQFQQPRDKKMNEIRIIIYDTNTFNEFNDLFLELSQDKKAKIKFDDM
jgi:O-acetyl-ADP-ribose deacetylase (regulator of RNase III)